MASGDGSWPPRVPVRLLSPAPKFPWQSPTRAEGHAIQQPDPPFPPDLLAPQSLRLRVVPRVGDHKGQQNSHDGHREDTPEGQVQSEDLSVLLRPGGSRLASPVIP